MIDDGVSLTLQFNLSGGFADRENAVFGSAASSNVGQTSVFGLRPYTVEEKFQMLKRMVARGQASLAPGVSFDTVKHEMKKPENDGLGIKELTSMLARKKMLKVAAPANDLKVKQPHLRPRF